MNKSKKGIGKWKKKIKKNQKDLKVNIKKEKKVKILKVIAFSHFAISEEKLKKNILMS